MTQQKMFMISLKKNKDIINSSIDRAYSKSVLRLCFFQHPAIFTEKLNVGWKSES